MGSEISTDGAMAEKTHQAPVDPMSLLSQDASDGARGVKCTHLVISQSPSLLFEFELKPQTVSQTSILSRMTSGSTAVTLWM